MTDQTELTIPQRLRVWSAAGVPVTLTAQQCRDIARAIEVNEILNKNWQENEASARQALRWAIGALAFTFFFALFGWMGL